MSTAAERTVNIPFENRKVYISRGTTPDDRTVLVKFENRTVYIERQTTSSERRSSFLTMSFKIFFSAFL